MGGEVVGRLVVCVVSGGVRCVVCCLGDVGVVGVWVCGVWDGVVCV
jgi:hypothetical protein